MASFFSRTSSPRWWARWIGSRERHLTEYAEVTGKKIPVERLKALPWARTSVEGQRQMEETGEASVGAFGPLGSLSERGVEQPGPARDDRQPVGSLRCGYASRTRGKGAISGKDAWQIGSNPSFSRSSRFL